MTDAKGETFRIGDRVMATPKAFENGVWPRHREPVYGKVTGHSRRPELIVVVLDGQVTPSSYHVDFWQHADEEAPNV